MKAKKEIIAVTADDLCLESYPCQHEITINYIDGTEKTKHSDGVTIAKKYLNYLNAIDREHFSGYVNLGMFANPLQEESSDTEENDRSNQI